MSVPSEERSLSVRVAEAIGWTHPGGFHDCCLRQDTSDGCVPHFDTDWSATGPLIDRLRIGVMRLPLCGQWMAAKDFDGGPSALARTPLLAVCTFIVSHPNALAAAGMGRP